MVRVRSFLVELSGFWLRQSFTRNKLGKKYEHYRFCSFARIADNSAVLTISTIKNDLFEPMVRVRSFLVELSGFEPLASSLRTRRSTNWAITPQALSLYTFLFYLSTIFYSIFYNSFIFLRKKAPLISILTLHIFRSQEKARILLRSTNFYPALSLTSVGNIWYNLYNQ